MMRSLEPSAGLARQSRAKLVQSTAQTSARLSATATALASCEPVSSEPEKKRPFFARSATTAARATRPECDDASLIAARRPRSPSTVVASSSARTRIKER
jgi:hypothetical protein